MELSEFLWAQIGLVLITGLLYFMIVVTRRSTSKANANYPTKEWNFYLKKLWTLYNIRKWKKSRQQDEINLEDETEEPIVISDHDNFDSQTIWAANTKGSSLYVAIHRKLNRMSEVSVILTMPDGMVYRLPNQPDTVVFDASSKTWNAGNLKIILLEPFRRWRIIYNGILAKGNQTEWSETEKDVLHVKFNFIWIAGSKPLRIIDDSSESLIADAVATEPWKSPDWFNGIKKYPVKGFDQYGSMSGIVTIDNTVEPTELFLAGVRERRWGLNYSQFMRRSLNLTGMTKDGTFYNIMVQSLKKDLTHLVFGNVRMPNSKMCPITWTDIDMSEIGEFKSHIRKAFTVKFTAASKQFTTLIHLDDTKTNVLRGGRPWNWENLIIPFQGSINDFQGVGILQLCYGYTGTCPLQMANETQQLSMLDIQDIKTDIICASFKDKASACPQFVGAKGASLALLSSVETDEYKVPNGFCLSIKALEQQLTFNEPLLSAIKDIENVNTNYDEKSLKAACERATLLFTNTPLCRPVEEAVVIYFHELLSSERGSSVEDLYFAVRSSGIGEDSEELSAAGQNATILGCKSVEDVLKAIQMCWASLFTHQSVEYRRQHGMIVNCGMGVVVQTMIDAEAAGVMFTRHPMTGDPSCILITSNYGLGESVVSGTVEPDTIYIEKDLKNNIKVKSIDIGSKSHKMSLDKMNNNVEARLQKTELTAESKKASLSDDECIKLGNIAISQEALWGSPRDIEWAVSKGIIYLVQARPITTMQTWNEFELLHELDTPKLSEDDLMTFANTGEVLPGSYSPLSHSTIAHYLDRSVSVVADKCVDPYFWNTLSSTHSHIGLNVINAILIKVSKEITLANQVMDVAIYGHSVTDENMHSVALHRNGCGNFYDNTVDMLDMLMNLWNNTKTANNATKFSNSFKIDLDKCTTSQEFYNQIDKHLFNLLDASNFHNKCSSISFFSQFIFFTILLEGKSEITTENYIDIAMILSSCTNVISAEVPTSLNNLAKSIRKSNNAEQFCKIEPENGMKWLQDNCDDSYNLFTEFLEKHGHRCIKEFDMLTDTWDLNPNNLILALQSALKAPLREEKKVQEDGDILSKLASNVKNSTRRILRFVVPICQKSVAHREQTKAALIYVIHKFRLAYRKLARQMMKEWKIPDEKLIFFMTHSELGQYIKSGNPEIINKAMLRRRFFPKWDAMKFSELCWGYPQPKNVDASVQFNTNDGDPIVKGTPVCSGSIVGRACVVNSLSEISQLENGDILIAHSTDIGWSPYFPLLGGVVTELGGLISHGAVVAREYGLPCIVGTENATCLFKTGDTVLLDATKGILRKVEAS